MRIEIIIHLIFIYILTIRPELSLLPLLPNNIPIALTELQLFNEIPTNKYSSSHITILQPNPFITHCQNDEQTLKILTHHLLSAKGLIREIRNATMFHTTLNEICNDIQFDKVMITEGNLINCIYTINCFKFYFSSILVDVNELNRKFSDQREILRELIDQINIVNDLTKDSFNKAFSYFKFITQNPLRKYVPSSVKFDGCNYQTLENEFLLYYRILKKK